MGNDLLIGRTSEERMMSAFRYCRSTESNALFACENMDKKTKGVATPTIGRIVLFRHSENAVFPAIVTRVHEPVNANEFFFVDLMVFTGFICEAFPGVLPGDTEGTWYWPPYKLINF